MNSVTLLLKCPSSYDLTFETSPYMLVPKVEQSYFTLTLKDKEYLETLITFLAMFKAGFLSFKGVDYSLLVSKAAA